MFMMFSLLHILMYCTNQSPAAWNQTAMSQTETSANSQCQKMGIIRFLYGQICSNCPPVIAGVAELVVKTCKKNKEIRGESCSRTSGRLSQSSIQKMCRLARIEYRQFMPQVLASCLSLWRWSALHHHLLLRRRRRRRHRRHRRQALLHQRPHFWLSVLQLHVESF